MRASRRPGGPSSPFADIRRWVTDEAVPLGRETWKEFSEDNGMLIAASVAFYTLLSLFPLLLAAIGILGIVLGSPERAESIIVDATREYAAGPQARAMIREVVEGGSAATGIGLILLLWSGSTIIVILQRAMDVAWDVENQPGFIKQRAMALVFLIIIGLLVALSVGASALATYVLSVGSPVLPDWPWISQLLSYAVTLAISILAFTLIYRLLPHTDVPWKPALIGGAVAGVLWEIAKQIFAFYVANFAEFSTVYGSIGGVILLLLWLNYSAVILLLGAELASVLHGRQSGQRTQAR